MSINSDIKEALKEQAEVLAAYNAEATDFDNIADYSRRVKINSFADLVFSFKFNYGTKHPRAIPCAVLTCCASDIGFKPMHYAIAVDGDLIREIAEACREYLTDCAERAEKDVLAGYRP